MERTPTLNGIMRELYEPPVLDGMPLSTRLEYGFTHPSSDRYRLALVASAFGVCSIAEIQRHEIKLAIGHEGHFIRLLERKLGELRQRHHFACAAERGGFY